MSIKFKLFSVVFGIAMFMAAPALAQTSPTQDAYSVTAARVQEQVQHTQASSGELPFTGLTLGVMVAVALALVLTGLVVRRLAVRRPTA